MNPDTHSTRIGRWSALVGMGTLTVTAALSRIATAEEVRTQPAAPSSISRSRVRKVATEEAFNIPAIAEAAREVVPGGGTNLGWYSLQSTIPSCLKTQTVTFSLLETLELGS